MQKKITFCLMILLFLGLINLSAEESVTLQSEESETLQTEEPSTENGNRASWNNFVSGIVNVYKAIEDGVITGYKAVEDGVVNAYRTIENWFTTTFNISAPEQASQTENSSNEIEIEEN